MKPNERAALMKVKSEIEKAHRVVDYRIFGSKAKGDDSAESDIDIMIEVEDYTQEIETFIDNTVYKINLEYDCLISALIFGSKELEEGPLRESPIYRSISREGVRM